MRKKEIKSPFKTRQIVLACVFIVLVLAFYVYWLFLKPISPDPGFASLRVASAADNPNGPEVQKILATNHAVRFDLPGCSNLHKVSDSLYRGAQPTKEGFENLKKLGIKTVVNLRGYHSDEELLAETGLDYKPIPMDTWDVTPDNVMAFLRIAADPNAAPVFVHCQHGSDRTGTMVAAYRQSFRMEPGSGYPVNDARRIRIPSPLDGTARHAAQAGYRSNQKRTSCPLSRRR
jgi:protein tyrosine phosphatase (PTP) superfamily phosphohydrolase (DUF442 family)